MRLTLEQRQAAVASALRALAAEPAPAPGSEPTDTVLDAVDARLDTLSRQLGEILARLDSVETALLESVWDHPADAPDPAPAEAEAPLEQVEPYAGDTAGDSAGAGDRGDSEAPSVSVPAIPLGEGRMSSAASRALFGH